MPTAPARQRLAGLMDARRRELRLRWQDVAEAGEISLKTLHSVRTGDAGMAALTERGIEAGLRWEPGSVGIILAGGDPVPVDTRPVLAAEPPAPDPGEDDTDPPMTPAMRAAMLEHLPAIEALVARATNLAAAEDPDRPVPRGAHLVKAGAPPNEGPRWDRLAETGAPLRWSARKRMKLMAIGRVLDAERRAQSRGREAGLTAMRA